MTITPETYRASAVSELPATIFVEGGASSDHPVYHYPLIRSIKPFDRVILSPNGRIDEKGVVDFSAGDPALGQPRVRLLPVPLGWGRPEMLAGRRAHSMAIRVPRDRAFPGKAP